MNKKITLALLLIAGALSATAQLSFTRIWERSDSAYQASPSDATRKPSYFSNQNTRGIAVGMINTSTGPQERVFLPSRHEDGNLVRVLDAATGADLKSLNMTGVEGGGFVISDAGMTDDGALIVSNCTHSSSGPFKLYKWTHEDQAPELVVSYPSGTARYGDKLSVTGKISDGTARIYTIAGAALSTYKVQYFGMEKTDGVWKFKQTPDELPTSITANSSNFHQFNPGPDNGFYFRSVGLNNFQQLKSDYSPATGNTHPTTIAQGSTVPVFIKTVGDYDYACYLRYGSNALYAKPAVNQAEVVRIEHSQGISSATVVATTPSLGKSAPGNGAGHVVVKHLPTGDADVFVLSTLNGVARYRLSGSAIGTGTDAQQLTTLKVTQENGELRVEGIPSATINIYSINGQLVASKKDTDRMVTTGLRGLFVVQLSHNQHIVHTQKIIF